jgi:GNAT superfamily N-acetyltransferase
MSPDTAAAGLEFVDLRRGSANRNSWIPPFDSAVTYEHPDWWNRPPYGNDDPWYVQAVENGVEVARVELDDPGLINQDYPNVPAVGDERLEIQLIEVATAARGRRVGTQVVQMLAERHQDRRLFAYSQDADRFWARLGWERFDHPEGDWRALFIQPARVVLASQS